MEEFKKIVALSFIKAKKDNPLATSKNALANIVSEEINKNENGSLIDEHRYSRTLLNYYNFYFNKGKQQTPSESIINKLLNYLEYDSQNQFIKNQPIDDNYLKEVPFVNYKIEAEVRNEIPPNETNQNTVEREARNTINIDDRWKKIVITISFISSITAITYLGIDWKLKNCMTWTGIEYEKVYCSKSFDPKIIPIDKALLKEFKKIEVDTNYTFFDDDAEAIVWYNKTGGKVEFFTKPGRHPTNNKTLKPVTQEIVRKYVFGEEE